MKRISFDQLADQIEARQQRDRAFAAAGQYLAGVLRSFQNTGVPFSLGLDGADLVIRIPRAEVLPDVPGGNDG